MKVFAISDLHLSLNNPKPMDIFGGVWDDYIERISASWNQKVTNEDVVLIAGDISWAMTLENAIPDLNFIGSFKGKKIIIRGNHDYWWKSISGLRAALPLGMYALQNDCLMLGDVIFCGSRGWSVEASCAEDEKIFSRELIRFELSLKQMEKLRNNNQTVIAMIHYPPFNARLESSAFTDLFEKYRVNKVVYGHLHGKSVRPAYVLNKNDVEYILTSCDQVKNELVTILDF